MKPTLEEIETVSGGTVVLEAGTLLSNINATSIAIREDSVVDTATIKDDTGTTYDYKNAYDAGGLNWNTLKANDLLFPGKNRTITAFKLTSGSALVNLL